MTIPTGKWSQQEEKFSTRSKTLGHLWTPRGTFTLCLLVGLLFLGRPAGSNEDVHPRVGEVKLSLSDSTNWNPVFFSHIPKSAFSFEENGVTLAVRNSSGFVIHPFKEPLHLSSFHLKFRHMSGSLNLTSPSEQGRGANDDFILKIGFAVEGDKRLNVFQKLMAPEWIKEVYSLGKNARGFSKVVFYNLVKIPELHGFNRSHPLHETLKENFVHLSIPPLETVHWKQQLGLPGKALGVWIQSDGDDSNSTYEILVEEVSLYLKEGVP